MTVSKLAGTLIVLLSVLFCSASGKASEYQSSYQDSYQKAVAALHRGELAQAGQLAEQAGAVAFLRFPGDNRKQAEVLLLRADVALARLALDPDLELADEARKLAEQAKRLPLDARTLQAVEIEALDILAGVEMNVGRFDMAVQRYEELLQRRRDLLGENHIDVLTTAVALSSALRFDGQLIRADRVSGRAVSGLEIVAPGQQILGVAYAKRGVIVVELGRADEAKNLAERALDILPEDGPTVARLSRFESEIVLALAAGISGDQDAGRAKARSALQGVEQLQLSPQHPLFAYADLAVNIFDNAGRRFTSDPGSSHPVGRDIPFFDILSKTSSARALWSARHISEAKAQYLSVLPDAEELLGSEHKLTRNILTAISALSWAGRRIDDAVDYMGRVLVAEERFISESIQHGSESDRLQLITTLDRSTDQAISLNLNAAPDHELASWFALTAILQRKGRVLDEVSRTRRALALVRDSETRDMLLRFNALRAAKTKTMFGVGTGSAESAEAAEEELLSLERKLSERVALEMDPASVTIPAVQAGLEQQEALVEYYAYRPYLPDPSTYYGYEYVAYVLRSRGTPVAVRLGSKAEIDALALDFRSALENREDVSGPSRALHERVLAPVLAKIGSDVTSLIVAPDGELNLVPFAALRSGGYLVEQFGVSYVTSGRDLASRDMHLTLRPPVLIGDIDFDGAFRLSLSAPEVPSRQDLLRGRYFPYLPNSGDEVRRINDIVGQPDTRVLSGREVTEARVKQLVRPKLLHVATHGFFVPSSGEDGDSSFYDAAMSRSGLALAGANLRNAAQAGDDGILTALEITEMDLRGTELVVLSACESGLGGASVGKGVFGLRRALIIAGSRSQLVTLWQASDLALRNTLVSWYSQLKAGAHRSDALRALQLAAIRGDTLPGLEWGILGGPDAEGGAASRAKGKHPYFWAHLVLLGERSSLQFGVE